MKPPEVVTIDFFSRQKYVVAKVLQGGMGSVYQLIPIHAASKPVALKTIKGKSSIRAFDFECEAWFSLAHHSNIARAFAFGTWNSLPSVIVDWYSQSLEGIRPDTLSGEQILGLIRGTVDALDFAHSEFRLIHQDIKPSNILIDDLGRPRLSDFGLARCVASTVRERIELGVGNIPRTTTAELSGTPYYMAPELWDGVRPSLRSDIYSLGVTFYQLLTAQHPYVEDKGKPLFGRHLRVGPLRAALARKGEHAPRIEEFIAKCLGLDPASRYASYQEMEPQLLRNAPKREQAKWTLERSEIVSGAARFYSTKGDTKKATELLERHLSDRPDDPVLLQGLANLKEALGVGEQVEKVLGEAYRILRNSNGIFEGSFVPGPVFGWANCLIRRERFAEAAEVIDEALGWEERICSSLNTARTLIHSGSYPEIGWYLLFRGEFKEAADQLARCAARTSLDKLQTIWMAEASWLAGVIRRDADEIVRRALSLAPDTFPKKGELEFVFCRLLLKEYANPILSLSIHNSTPSYVFGEAIKLEKQYGLKGGSVLMAKTTELQFPIMALLDQLATGGKHNEHIRTVSKSRVG